MIRPTHEARFSSTARQYLDGGGESIQPTAHAADVPVEFALLTEGRAQRLFGVSTRAKATLRVDRGIAVSRENIVTITAADRGDSLNSQWVVAQVLNDGSDDLLLELVPPEVHQAAETL